MEYILHLHNEEKRWPKMGPDEFKREIRCVHGLPKRIGRSRCVRGGNRLEPTTTATQVRVTSDGKTSVLDGPYAETKEQLGGYFIIDVADLDAALSWAARCPCASHGTVEVRPVAAVPAPA